MSKKKTTKKTSKKVNKKNGVNRKKNGVATKTVKTVSSGQSGPPIELPVNKMNEAELQLLRTVYTPKGARKPQTLRQLQDSAFDGGDTTTARNALRRLVRAGWIEKVGRGEYRLTDKGRKRGQRGLRS